MYTRAQNQALISLPVRISHLEREPVTSHVEKCLLWNIPALKGTDLRENKRNRIQQQIMFLQRRVTYTWNSAKIRANPIYRCKIFAKAHPRAKVFQTNTYRLKAARKISEWAGCLLLLVHWQLIRFKTEPSPAFFRCRTFLWWFTWPSPQKLIMPHSEVILQLIPSSALMY